MSRRITRVAFLTGSSHRAPRFGGEVRVFQLAKRIASDGIKVKLFGSRFSDELMSPDLSQAWPKDEWSGGDLYPLSLRSLLSSARNIRPLMRRVQELNTYDVIISELDAAWQLLGAGYLIRAPLILNEHNVEWYLLRQREISTKKRTPWRRLQMYERICHAAFDRIVVESAVDQAIFETNGTPNQKMVIVPNGVDTGSFRPDARIRKEMRRRYRLDDNVPLVLYTGSMGFFPNREAVTSILTKIYPQAKNLIPNLQLMLLGQGFGTFPIPIPSEVILPGGVDSSAVPSFTNAADICLAPLKYGSGVRLKILEWMSCGKPIIATAKAVESIEVTQNENIILEENLDKYPFRIAELCQDQNLRRRLGERARDLIERRYNWESVITPLKMMLKTL